MRRDFGIDFRAERLARFAGCGSVGDACRIDPEHARNRFQSRTASELGQGGFHRPCGRSVHASKVPGAFACGLHVARGDGFFHVFHGSIDAGGLLVARVRDGRNRPEGALGFEVLRREVPARVGCEGRVFKREVGRTVGTQERPVVLKERPGFPVGEIFGRLAKHPRRLRLFGIARFREGFELFEKFGRATSGFSF